MSLAAVLCLASPAQAITLDEDDLLLLDMTLERQTLASSVTAYAVGDSAVVSLAEASAALEFPIVVDPAAGTAKGSFIRPDRGFALDLAGGFVEIEGKRQAFSADEAFVHHGALFVSVAALSRWFPVDLRFQPTSLSLQVSPRERLPLQERQARRSDARQNFGVGPATLPLIDTPYQLAGPHAADIGLGYSIRRPPNGANTIKGLSYSALVGGDLAYMDSHAYLSGNATDLLTEARFSLSRDKLDLPLGLRYVEVGDIVPALVPGVSYSGVERGFLIQGGGSAIGRDDLIDSDSINLSGDALPGWDVELFQNGMRVAFQTVGANGRYNFTNLDPQSGVNKFELVFYGPAGERRSEVVTRHSGLGPDQPGSVRYQFSASQKGTQLYAGNTPANPDMTDRGTTRLAAGLEVRVLPQLSLRGSWNNLMVDGERLDYYSLGASAAWRDITLTAEALHDTKGGSRWNGSVQLPATMTLGGFDTRFSHTQYAQSMLADATQSSDQYALRLSSRTGVVLSGPIGPTTTQFSLFHNREPGRTSNSASGGFTANLRGVAFGNTLSYYQFGSSPTGATTADWITGNAFLSAGANPVSLRAGLSYTLQPEAVAREYFIDSNLSVSQDMSMNFGMTYNPISGVSRYISGLNWQLPQVTLSPRLTYDSSGEYSGFVYAAFSLAPRPDRPGVMLSGRSLATSGTVAARVFLDNDGSNTFSAGDEPLPNVLVRTPQAFRTGTTDASGVAYVTGISSPRATDVILARETLPSTQMEVKHEGNSVRPRPTAVAIVDFPVVLTGDIEGHVYTLQDGKRVPLAGAMVELRGTDGSVAAFRTSMHDGFFLFDGVAHAAYSLNLAGDQRDNATQPKVALNRERSVQSDIDIVVTPLAKATPPAAPVAQASRLPALTPVAEQVTPVAQASRLPALAPVAEQAAPAAPVAQASRLPVTPQLALAVVPTEQPEPTTSALAALPSPTEPAPAARPKSLDGRLAQLGAFPDIDGAQAYQQKLLGLGLLQPAQITIATVDLGRHGLFHRVVATPIASTADELCTSLRALGTECFTIVQ